MLGAFAIVLVAALLLATVALLRTRERAARAEAEAEALKAGLVDSTRLASLGNLVAGLVHEINTPMGALVSNHDVLHRALTRLQTILADERVDEHELHEVRKIVRALDEITDVNTQAVQRMAADQEAARARTEAERAARVEAAQKTEEARKPLQAKVEAPEPAPVKPVEAAAEYKPPAATEPAHLVDIQA